MTELTVIRHDPARGKLILEEPFFNLATWVGGIVGAVTVLFVGVCTWGYISLISTNDEQGWIPILAMLLIVPFVGKFLLPLSHRQVVIIDRSQRALILGSKVGGFVFSRSRVVPLAEIVCIEIQSHSHEHLGHDEYWLSACLRDDSKITLNVGNDQTAMVRLGQQIAKLIEVPLREQVEGS